VLDQTPFYGEAGGQAGDKGRLNTTEGTVVSVTGTLRYGDKIIVHQGVVEQGTLREDDQVDARVNAEKRAATARHHTATHLLHAALREILGEHVKQAGSLVSPDRLRFDFTHFTQVETEKLRAVEDLVNRYIRENQAVSTREMPLEQAVKSGATAIFEERYGDTVRVVEVEGGVSRELCGGTHTRRTGDIGLFKIVSEAAVGANLRRIEALGGEPALAYVQERERELRAAASALKVGVDQVEERVERLLKYQRDLEREIESLRDRIRSSHTTNLMAGASEVGGVKVLAREVEADSPKALRAMGDRVKERMESGVAVLGARNGDKAMLLCIVSPDLTDRIQAGRLIGRLSPLVGGKGGGRPDMAQGGGSEPQGLDQALGSVPELVEEMLGTPS
ncbi:MAG: DHHA1 domain-containing protein, partial [Desulfobacteraceae bacterium]